MAKSHLDLGWLREKKIKTPHFSFHITSCSSLRNFLLAREKSFSYAFSFLFMKGLFSIVQNVSITYRGWRAYVTWVGFFRVVDKRKYETFKNIKYRYSDSKWEKLMNLLIYHIWYIFHILNGVSSKHSCSLQGN